MDKKEIVSLVNDFLQPEYSEYAIFPGSITEHEKCFSCMVHTKKYIESRDIMDAAIGFGPTIICKSTGKLFQTGSSYSLEQYLASFNKTGDPYGDIKSNEELGLYCTVEIFGISEAFNYLEVTRSLKFHLNQGLGEVKPKVESLKNGEVLSIRPDSISEVEPLALELEAAGCKVRII